MDKRRVKIFLKLKAKEILTVAAVIVMVAIGMAVLVGLVYLLEWIVDNFHITTITIAWILVWLTGIWGSLVVCHAVWKWLKSNWEEAGELAREEEKDARSYR